MTNIRFTENKLTVVAITFLLLASSFVFLPAFAANISPRATIAGPVHPAASVAGATATIDYPVLNGYSAAVTRTITVTNPTGNPAIASLTVSIPSAAASAVPNPTGAGTCVSGVPYTCTVSTFGSGPWAVVYTVPSGDVLVPGGAAIKLSITFTTEVAAGVSTSQADPYSLSVSATDPSGQSTNLNSIGVYETTTVTLSKTDASPLTQTAGTPFTEQVITNPVVSGLPLAVSVTAGTSKDITLSPTSFISGSSASSVSVNDTKAETPVTVSFTGNGTFVSPDANGQITPVGSGSYTINPGAASTLQVAIGGQSPPTTSQINETTFAPIAGSSIIVSSTDAFGNARTTGAAVTVTLTATSTGGSSTAGFSATGSAYTGNYPYMPSDIVTSLVVTIPLNQASVTLTGHYFFSVDYGATSYVTATASGLTSGTSSIIKTWGFTDQTVTLSHVTPVATETAAAGSSVTITAELLHAQANLPITFSVANNNTDYNGLSGKATQTVTTAIVTSGSTPTANASATLTINTDAITPAQTKVSAFGNLTAGQTFGLANLVTSTALTHFIQTKAASLSTLTVSASFNSGYTGTSPVTTVSGQALYISAEATDAYGNPITPSADTQVTFSATGGLLSTTTATIYAGSIPPSTNSTWTLQTVISLTPTSGASSMFVTAKANVAGTAISGNETISVVSQNPTMTLNAPTTWTSGVSTTLSGIANVSVGLSGVTLNGAGASIKYSVNGATATSSGVNEVFNTAGTGVAYTITTLLTSSANFITVTVTDSAGHTVSMSVQVPTLQANQRFAFSTAPQQTTILGQTGVNATVENQYSGNLTAYVYFKVINSQNQTVQIYQTITTLTPLSTQNFAVGLVGLTKGTYTVQVFVLDSSQAPASPSDTVTVTV